MPDNIEPQSDRIGNDFSRGPNPAPGGKVDVEADAPPYEGRTGGDSNNPDTRASVERQMEGSEAGQAGQTASAHEESPAQSADAESPESHKGVGTGGSRHGEDMVGHEGKERGRSDDGSDDDTGRPVGTSDETDRTGI